MFARRWLAWLMFLVVVVFLALGAARPSTSATDETSYVVKPGDTLWEIAATRYDGDPREGMWRIKQRNGLRESAIFPGDVLVLPP